MLLGVHPKECAIGKLLAHTGAISLLKQFYLLFIIHGYEIFFRAVSCQ